MTEDVVKYDKSQNIFEKLLEIRKSIEYIQKTERGNQGAMYVNPAVFLKTVRDKMNALGVILYPSVVEGEISHIKAPTKNNKENMSFLFSASASYTFINASNPKDNLVVPWFMTGSHLQDPAMAEGGALTYSERYFLLKFFQIPTATDDPEYFESKTSEKITEEQVIQLTDIVESKGYAPKPVLQKYAVTIVKVGDISNLPVSKFEQAKTFFSNMDQKK